VASGKRIVATSPYDVVVENLDRNLHTLLFLDIQPDRYMTASEGAALLLEMEEISGGDRLRTALGVGVARAGSDDAVVIADRLPKLADRDLGGPLHILVVPGRLHFMEAEGLVALAGAPAEILDGAGP
jgi:diphthine synthase